MDWGNIIAAGINTVGGLVGGLFGLDAQEDQLEQARADKEEDWKKALYLEALKAKYAGGGGGGGGGADNRLTPAQALAAMNNVQQNKQAAINELINSYVSSIR